MKKICASKDTIKEVKTTHRMGKNILGNLKSDKGLVSRLHK